MASSSAPVGAGAGAGSGLPQVAPLSKFKVVFLGDQGTGKTSIIKSFMYGSWEAAYSATIGIDFLSKTLYLDDRTIRLQIWDSAGQERFRSLIPSYIRDSSVAVVVYDITSRSSFTNASRWIEDVRAERGGDVVIMLVGNKTDLADKRAVAAEEGAARAAAEGVLFIETSAKGGFNVKALFRRLATALPGSAARPPTAAESNLIDIRIAPTPPEARREGGCAC